MSENMIACTFVVIDSNFECKIANQKISKGKIILKGETNESVDNNKKNVVSLDIQNCEFESFSENFQDLFPNVTKLSINGGKLLSIGPKHVGKWEKMTHFEITNCGLKHIYNGIFKNMHHLKKISFSNNDLEEVGPNILDELPYLDSAFFSGNKNINLNYDRTYPQNNYYYSPQFGGNNTILNEIRQHIKTNCAPVCVSQLEYNETVEDLKAEISRQAKDILRLTEMINVIIANPDFKDFKINIGKISFNVHKTIFASRSPIFAEMLENNPDAKELNLEDINEATFKAIYDFIYKEKLPTADEKNQEIFAAAKRLKIEELAEISVKHLLSNVNEENSFDLLVLSNKFDHQELRMKAFENIQTKIFPERRLDQELAKQPEKLKKLIEIKKKLENEFESI